MDTVELLQQIGLNKYEAEAYFTLLAEGPLTGYELGKRSQVPLSRSYEILERLTQKGLALVQPGDPPRYTAGDPARFLAQVRSNMAATLDSLANALTSLSRPDTASEFWIVRGRQHILSHARALITDAQQAIDLSLPASAEADAADVIALARTRGCAIRQRRTAEEGEAANGILLLVDGRQALVGALSPAQHCQAVTCAHPALVALLRAHFGQQVPEKALEVAATAVPVQPQPVQSSERLTWIAWEDRKQHRLWKQTREGRVA